MPFICVYKGIKKKKAFNQEWFTILNQQIIINNQKKTFLIQNIKQHNPKPKVSTQ